jgi:hypothetical protein
VSLIYHSFKTGYYEDFAIEVVEWDEARARALGETESRLDDFAAIFRDLPPQYDTIMSAI